MEKGKIGVQMMMLKEEIRRGGMRPAMEKLADLGYQVHKVQAVDLFPRTAHVETVVQLSLTSSL